MKNEIILASLLIALAIALVGFTNRFEIDTTGFVAWRIDGFTGEIKFCDSRTLRCVGLEGE